MKPQALILDFGGVITRTLFESHALTEANLGLAPGTLTWRGPFDPAGDALWRDMQADRISERDYWLGRTREGGLLVGGEFGAFARDPTQAREVQGPPPHWYRLRRSRNSRLHPRRGVNGRRTHRRTGQLRHRRGLTPATHRVSDCLI